MDLSAFFESAGPRGIYRPRGDASACEMAAMVVQAARHAVRLRLSELVVDLTRLRGLRVPSVADRFRFAERLAQAAGSRLRIVVIADRRLIDPQKFGVMVAANRGLCGEIFDTEDAALAWLDLLDQPLAA